MCVTIRHVHKKIRPYGQFKQRKVDSVIAILCFIYEKHTQVSGRLLFSGQQFLNQRKFDCGLPAVKIDAKLDVDQTDDFSNDRPG